MGAACPLAFSGGLRLMARRRTPAAAQKNVILLRDEGYFGGMEFVERFVTVDEAKEYLRTETEYGCDDEAQAYSIAPVGYKVNVTRKVEVTLAEEAI
jgi:hypothetical protein